MYQNEPEPSTSYELYTEPEAGPSGISQEIRRNLTAYHNNRRTRHLSTSSDDDDDDDGDDSDDQRRLGSRILGFGHRLMEATEALSSRTRIPALSGSNVRLLSSDECPTNNTNMDLLTAPDLQLDWMSDSTDQSVDELVCSRNTSNNTQPSAKIKTEPPLQIDLTNEPDDDIPSTSNRNTSDIDAYAEITPVRHLRQGLFGDSYPNTSINVDSIRLLNQNAYPSHNRTIHEN